MSFSLAASRTIVYFIATLIALHPLLQYVRTSDELTSYPSRATALQVSMFTGFQASFTLGSKSLAALTLCLGRFSVEPSGT